VVEKLSRCRIAFPFSRSTVHHLNRKKNREENKFSSRVEVRVVTPKKAGVVQSSVRLNAFSSSLIFSLLLFSLPSTNSPLSIRNTRKW
jgi:hypothetical protein